MCMHEFSPVCLLHLPYDVLPSLPKALAWTCHFIQLRFSASACLADSLFHLFCFAWVIIFSYRTDRRVSGVASRILPLPSSLIFKCESFLLSNFYVFLFADIAFVRGSSLIFIGSNTCWVCKFWFHTLNFFCDVRLTLVFQRWHPGWNSSKSYRYSGCWTGSTHVRIK